MKITADFIVRFQKICFSAVILQLLYISFCIAAYISDPVSAYPALPPPICIPEMLEYTAMSALLTVIGGWVFDYIYIKSTN